MDRRERTDDASVAMLAVLAGARSEIWTALPGIVQSFDPVKRTCAVQPTIQAQFENEDGSTSWINLPVLVDCPVVFPSGGGLLLTFPIEPGDECLVIFASRCIDNWWQSGGIRRQAELRMHDLSDGFVIAGVESVPNVTPGISTSGAELRTRDGSAKVRVAQDGTIDVISPGSVNVQAPTINAQGTTVNINAAASIGLNAPAVTLNGAVAVNGSLTINGGAYATHQHSNVQNGPNNTGGVV